MTATQTSTSHIHSAPLQRRGHTRRARLVLLIFVAVVVAAAVLELTWGIGIAEAVGHFQYLLGSGGHRSFALRLRLPRVAMALVAGAALGVAGAIFQTTLRNPLASPDIVGITAGASVGGAWAILAASLSGAAVTISALCGALVAAAIILTLSYKGTMSGYRFVLIGIGVAFVSQSLVGYFTTRADENDLQAALAWLVGSIGTPAWSQVALLALVMGALFLVAAALAPRLRILQLSDESAATLGVAVSRSRTYLLIIAVLLAGSATAMVGPVAFVAFMAGPIARRALHTSNASLVASALVGAAIMTLALCISDQWLGNFDMPVGIITGAIGAPYLLWLLASQGRRNG